MLERFLIVWPEAEEDIDSAYRWYRKHCQQVAEEFLRVVERSFNSIESSPKQYPVVYRNVRRATLRRFPYCIFFKLEPVDELSEQITIVACRHARRNPKTWQSRLS